jgi:hypothetical protein
MPARLITAPVVEPVSLPEAKKHLRLENSIDDDYVTGLIVMARQYLEHICWRSFMLQTWEISLPGFRGDDRLELTPEWQPSPYASGFAPTSWLIGSRGYKFRPFLELDRGHLADTPNVAVTYYDADNVLQTLPSSHYYVTGVSDETRCGRLWLNEPGGFFWPNVAVRPDAVRVTATYGYLNTTKVPEPIKHAIKLMVSQMYEQRTPQVTGTIVANIDFTIDALIAPYRFNIL